LKAISINHYQSRNNKTKYLGLILTQKVILMCTYDQNKE